ncbi:MAG: hypothetical protein M1832_003201 [Thelocarpon impressellum]|nr:MAG: hypothetical protein M1832_003201 [Thelocarpon impressellum]
MAIRTPQASGIWFWLALVFFLFVVFNHSGAVLPASYKLSSIRTTGRSLQDRVELAERSWEDWVERRHEMVAAQPMPNNIPFFPAQTLPQFGKTPWTVWDYFPAVWSCPWDIQRVGRLGDGGKWICGMSRYEERVDKPSVIYSFGVNAESTFEQEIMSRTNAELYAFDFSVDDVRSVLVLHRCTFADLVFVSQFGPQLAPEHRNRSHFMKVGLGSEDQMSRTPPFYTLKTLMDVNGHDYIDMLKIDVEGSEYVALDTFMDDFQGGPLPIGQIMIELHLNDDKAVSFKRFYDWWERLEGFGMRATWLEVNLLAVTLGTGHTDPRCVEVRRLSSSLHLHVLTGALQYVWVNAKDPKNILLEE